MKLDFGLLAARKGSLASHGLDPEDLARARPSRVLSEIRSRSASANTQRPTRAGGSSLTPKRSPPRRPAREHPRA